MGLLSNNQVETVCRLWVGYREGELERGDVQAWFGVHELLMRRCTLRQGRRPAFTHSELVSLTGLSASKVRASICRLERAKLLSWSEHRLVVEEGATGTLAALIGLPAMLVRRHEPSPHAPRSATHRSAAGSHAPTGRDGHAARPPIPWRLLPLRGVRLLGDVQGVMDCSDIWGRCPQRESCPPGIGTPAAGCDHLESQHWHRQRYGGTFVVTLAWDCRNRVGPPK